MSSFGTYLVGFLLVIVGLAIGAYLLNVPPTWIGVAVLVMATTRTRPEDPPTV